MTSSSMEQLALEPQSTTTPTRQAMNLSARTFTVFSQLPTELQLMVWKHAVPNPRLIVGALLIGVDLDLGNLRAILPSIQEFKSSYSRSKSPSAEIYWDSMKNQQMWEMEDRRMGDSRRPILSLLHGCRASRKAALATYRLDITSILLGEDIPPWNSEEDIIYFLPARTWQENIALLHWLSQRKETPQSILSSVQHLALLLNNVSSRSLGVHGLLPEFFGDFGNEWFRRFPTLQSLSLFIDPLRSNYAKGQSIMEDVEIVLFEPLNTPINEIRYLTANQIEHIITKMFRDLPLKGRDLPLVEVFVTDIRYSGETKIAR